MTSDPLAAPEPASAAAVLETGIMGSAMARHLVQAGLRTTRLARLEALSRQWHTAVEAGYGREDVSAARLALGRPARAGG